MSSYKSNNQEAEDRQAAGSHLLKHSRIDPVTDSRVGLSVTHLPFHRSNRDMRRPFVNQLQLLRVTWITIALLALLVSVRRPAVSATAADTKAPVPVLVELFTSEGCSSCPPADEVLARLDTQPLQGVHAIVLSEHVTYWNQQGWHDPFSLDAVTDRQRQYGSRFNLNDVYTPQAVVDGSVEMNGSNGVKLGEAVLKAAATPKADLSIATAQWANGAMQFSVHGSANPDASLWAALAEDSAQVSVLHGENGGRTLHHVAVVRVLQEMGKASADAKSPVSGKMLLLRPTNPKDAAKETGPIRLVVFLADRHSGRVIAVVEQTVPRT